MISRIPSDPAALNQWLHNAQLWALDAKSQLPSYSTTDVGGQVLVREQVPGKAPTTVGALKKSATPGELLTNQRGWAELGIKQQEVAMGGKPPPGYRWTPEGNLAAIPGGPGDKLSDAQTKQVLGVQNLQSAISDYRNALESFPTTGIVNPNDRARMGTFYNNMMLQAKEAYNLGVLNGPDYDILTSVITDPRSIKGAITSKSALDMQAANLDKLMRKIGETTSVVRPRMSPSSASSMSAPTAGTQFGVPADIQQLMNRYGGEGQ